MVVTLKAESWIWYSVVMVIVILRFVGRVYHLGSIKRLTIEDYLMVFTTITYTLLIVFLNIEANYPSNNIAPEDFDQIVPAEVPRIIYGSKLVVVVEQLWCATVWGCKACLLLMYSNLTNGLNQNKIVKMVAIYTFGGYIIMEILFFSTWCRPFYNYWSVPPANFECATYQDHLIVNLVFNVTSDLMMLCIPAPILARSKLPIQKKIILCGIFSLGLFVILCAILSKAYSLSLPYGIEWLNWYVREVSVAVMVANIPHCWSLLRKFFHLRAFLDSTKSRLGNSGGISIGRSGLSIGNAVSVGTGTGKGDKSRKGSAWTSSTASKSRKGSNWSQLADGDSKTITSPTESQEHINKGVRGEQQEIPMEIWKEVEVSVASREVNPRRETDLEAGKIENVPQTPGKTKRANSTTFLNV